MNNFDRVRAALANVVAFQNGSEDALAEIERQPTDEECERIDRAWGMQAAEANNGRAMWKAVREVMK